MRHKGKRRPVAERFWSKVAGGDYTTCWQWTGAANSRTGYGSFGIEDRKFVMPHRFAFETLRAEIPAGLQIDHLCRNRLCVNPWHMEAVTPRVNVRRSLNPAAANARRQACVNGHPFTEDNIYRTAGKPHRKCRTCHNERARRARMAGRTAEAGESR